MDPGRKCEEQQKERIYQSISSLFFLNEFEYCSFLPDRINSNNSQIKMKKKYEFKSVVAETLLIPLYMRAKESRRKDAILRDRQAEQLVGGEVWFDVCGPMMANSKYIKPDSLREHEAQIRSGLKDGHEVENWEPRLQLIDQALYQKFFPKRWGLGGRLMGLFPGICKKFSSLLGYKIK